MRELILNFEFPLRHLGVVLLTIHAPTQFECKQKLCVLTYCFLLLWVIFFPYDMKSKVKIIKTCVKVIQH